MSVNCGYKKVEPHNIRGERSFNGYGRAHYYCVPQVTSSIGPWFGPMAKGGALALRATF